MSFAFGLQQEIVLFTGFTRQDSRDSQDSQELSKGEGAFVELPPLSCGAIYCAAAFAIMDESHSALWQVLLLGSKRPKVTQQLRQCVWWTQDRMGKCSCSETRPKIDLIWGTVHLYVYYSS
jgi:hypothetical protein